MLDKTLRMKGEKCIGGKLSKERVTVIVGANMSESEKRKLLVIGKSKNPQCFKHVKNLPVKYDANKKAWMMSEIFTRVIRDRDSELRIKNKKIVVSIDNCPAHTVVDNLANITMIFFPANATSILQPMDQGVIRSLKCHFRQKLILNFIENCE